MSLKDESLENRPIDFDPAFHLLSKGGAADSLRGEVVSMLGKSAKSLIVVALFLLMGSAAKVQAGVLSGDGMGSRISAAAANANDLQSWRPYHAEFADVVPYLSAWALFRPQSSLDRCQPEMGRATSPSDSGGLPVESPNQLQKLDNTADCQTSSAGAGSSAPERPPVPQSGLSAATEYSASQMVMRLVNDNQSLSIPKQVFRLFRPPRFGSLS
jgi:hypothetical protein